jgi:hypothetical protein
MEMTPSEPVPVPVRVRVLSTEEAVECLRAALEGAGLVLPSLGVDPVTAASGEPFALVALGWCNVRTAERLAAVLRGGVGEEA